MIKVTGVRFRSAGKIYYFDPADFDIKKGDNVNVNINPEQALDAETTLIVIANVAKLGAIK